MNKKVRVVQVLFSITGFIVTLSGASLSLMVTHSALSSDYTLQVIGAVLFLLCFAIAIVLFIVSIFKPKAFYGLIIIPVLLMISIYLENSSYKIDHKINEIIDHRLIGSVLELKKNAFLISNLPKKRLRNHLTLCKHDYELDDTRYGITPVTRKFWEENFESEYKTPIFEEVTPPQTFDVIGAFVCEGRTYLSLKNFEGKNIEISILGASILFEDERLRAFY